MLHEKAGLPRMWVRISLAFLLSSSPIFAALGETRAEISARYQTPIFSTRETTTKRSSAAEFKWRAYRVLVVLIDRLSALEVFSAVSTEDEAKRLLKELHPELTWTEVKRDDQSTSWEADVYTARFADRKLRLSTKGIEIDDPRIKQLPDLQ